MPKFIQSLDLNEQFFHKIVAPLLKEHFPDLVYSAARLGKGSDVLGYDTEMSTDHDWGIRMQLFLSVEKYGKWETAVAKTLRHNLPQTFLDHSVHFSSASKDGTRLMIHQKEGLVDHRIEITTIPQFFHNHMRLDLTKEITVLDWLTTPQQLLLGVTKGRVFVDGLQELKPIRQKLAYFPHDVWLYLMAMQWVRIGQEEHFVGRTGFVGDEIGSQLLAGRLVHDVMLLCFLMEKRYAPYPKWFGTGFGELECAAILAPILEAILSVSNWQARENQLCSAYQFVANRHNQLNITPPLATECVPFHERPFHTIDAERFATAIKQVIQDPTILAIKSNVGSIDQFSNSTDLQSYPALHRRLGTLYEDQHD